jgi:hypothetical protein
MSPPSSVKATHRKPSVDIAGRHEGCRRAILVISLLVCVPLQASAGQTVGAMTGAIDGTASDSTEGVLRTLGSGRRQQHG